jgi:hypothetical protein
MRDVWVATGESPTVYRYIDWLITVPMQIVEFYLILAAVVAVSLGVFWKLFIASLVMLIGGYLGEAGLIDATVGFVVGMLGWIFIIYYVFAGEAAQIKDAAGNENLTFAFNGIKWIVTVGWAIYPLGYFLGYLGGGVDANALNIIYNLADLVNKFLFGLVIWYAAMRDSGHVFIGTCFLTVCLLRLNLNHFTREHHFGFEAAAWYWHFVDVVWLFLFVTVYWWGS